jgi:hypothetical protein
MRIGLPLNWFNLLSLILLFYICNKLAVSWGLSKHESLVFSFAIITLNSVLRLVLNQTVDVWVAVFFAWSLYLFRKKESGFYFYFFLGTAVGLLIGVKYSGLLFAIALGVFFYRHLPQVYNIRKLLAFLFPVLMFGLSWFIRNYILTGNPIYPGRLLDFPFHPQFKLQDWSTLKTLFLYKNGFLLFLQALVSEYLFWALSFVVFPLIIFLYFAKRLSLGYEIKLLACLGLVNLCIYLLLPSWPGNVISDLRYAFVVVIPSSLAVFLLAKKLGTMNELILISLLSSISVITQFTFRPKIIFIWLIMVILVLTVGQFKRKRI